MGLEEEHFLALRVPMHGGRNDPFPSVCGFLQGLGAESN